MVVPKGAAATPKGAEPGFRFKVPEPVLIKVKAPCVCVRSVRVEPDMVSKLAPPPVFEVKTKERSVVTELPAAIWRVEMAPAVAERI